MGATIFLRLLMGLFNCNHTRQCGVTEGQSLMGLRGRIGASRAAEPVIAALTGLLRYARSDVYWWRFLRGSKTRGHAPCFTCGRGYSNATVLQPRLCHCTDAIDFVGYFVFHRVPVRPKYTTFMHLRMQWRINGCLNIFAKAAPARAVLGPRSLHRRGPWELEESHRHQI